MSPLERIQNLPIILFLLIAGLLGYMNYSGSQTGIEGIENQIEKQKALVAEAESKVSDAKKFVSDRKKFEEEMNKVSDQLRAAVEYLPTKLNSQDVLTKISNEARSSGVNLASIQPKNSQAKGFYEELLMEVEVEGSYGQLVTFLSYISRIQRIVNIRGLDLKVKQMTEDGPILAMRGTLVAYRYMEGK